MDDPEIQEGKSILESVWYLVAISIVDLAIQTYGLTPEQARALRDVYLKTNHYFVELKL